MLFIAAKKAVSPKPMPTAPLRRSKPKGSGAIVGSKSPVIKIVNSKRAIAIIPLIKFSCSGGILCPKSPYITDAIAHKQAADSAATSPLPSVSAIIKKLLKIICSP
jgi:hypothetical protein